MIIDRRPSSAGLKDDGSIRGQTSSPITPPVEPFASSPGYPAESVAVLVSNKERRLLAKPKRRPRLWLKLTSLNRISRSAHGKTDSKYDLSRLERYPVHWDYYRFRPRVYTAFIASESS